MDYFPIFNNCGDKSRNEEGEGYGRRWKGGKGEGTLTGIADRRGGRVEEKEQKKNRIPIRFNVKLLSGKCS